MSVRILEGDALTVLQTLPDCSVQMCVTSPPYFGLRDYGVVGQLGLEKTPELYVEAMVGVFREVKRVLRDDGTLWLNIGDSYAGSGKGGNPEGSKWKGFVGNSQREAAATVHAGKDRLYGCKPKDLIGIPWALAKALRDPYYAGKIKDERDRIWLAAMLDAEGCLFIHKRKEGQHNGQGYYRKNANYGPGLEISNTHEAIVRRCMEIAGVGSICTQDGGRRQRLYRWNVRTTESRDVVRELYPYLIAKQHQARILYGCPSSGERADAAHGGLMALHRGSTTDVDFPAPATLYEKGWYLRSDIIWSKLNPMPESVTDRPTKSHEYLFLLSKSPTYYYDADAIAEQSVSTDDARFGGPRMAYDRKTGPTLAPDFQGQRSAVTIRQTRNARSVWTVNTSPYSEAHFATFPPKLIEPCILAGSAKQACEKCGAPWKADVVASGGTIGKSWHNHEDDLSRGQRGGDDQNAAAEGWKTYKRELRGYVPTCDCENSGTGKSLVLDPFGGAGTTGLVADRLGRDALLIELNPKYVEMARRRIHSDNPLFGDVA